MLYILSALAGAALFAAGFYVGLRARPAPAGHGSQATPEPQGAPNPAREGSAEAMLLKMNKQWANMMAYNGEAQDAG